MLKIFLLLAFFSLPAAAQDYLSWQPLEVTAVEEDEEEENSEKKKIDLSSFQNANQRVKKMVIDLKESLAGKPKKNERKVQAVTHESIYSAIVEMIETSYPGGLEAMVEANERIGDEIYQLIMALPKYAYQYVGPFIHDMPHVPDRVLNIPGIKETKGKLPTRIAPQMQEYVKKYGKYMSTHFYIYLMPEAWATPEREKRIYKYDKIIPIKNGKPEGLFNVNVRSIFTKYRMPDAEKYRTGEALEKIFRPQTPAGQVTPTSSITEGDVEAALASFQSIEETLGTNRFDKFHTALRDMALSDNNLMGELLNPMQTLVDKINRLPEKEKFAQAVARHGFTPESWALTVDKMIKARRVAKMSPGIALTLATWRRLKKPPKYFDMLTPYNRQVSWDSIQLFLGMYSSTPENVLAVKNYGDNIRKAFSAKDMMFIETPVFGIF